MDIGERMLVCGAEVHRVEDSIKRMCIAFGASRVDVFIITSSMIATVYKDEQSYTQTRRITATGTDYQTLHLLNGLSRKICSTEMSAAEIKKEYDEILKTKPYPFWLVCIAYCAIAGSFSLFFSGGIKEAAVAAVIGIILSFAALFSDKVSMNKIFAKFISSFIMTSLAFFALKLGLITKVDNVIIGNIMLLIPGIGFTNALRDLFMGDSIAGLLRTIEAVLTALAIALGYFLLTFFLGGVAA